MTPDWEAKLLQRAAGLGIDLAADTAHRLGVYADLLLRWGSKMDLVGGLDPEEILEKQILDSLTGLLLLEGKGQLVDLGSGAGLPGLVLALARGEELSVRSVESKGKKAAFQRRVVGELGLPQVLVDERRAEEVIREEAPPRWVTARAVASIDELLRLTLPWLKEGALLLAYKGPKADEELAAARPILQAERLNVLARQEIVLPSGAKRTLLLVGRST